MPDLGNSENKMTTNEQPEPASPSPVQNAPAAPDAATGLDEKIWNELRQCYDPEIPLNIVDLGLVYGVEVKDGLVSVKMTLTSPGCHLGGQIASTVQERVLALDTVEEASVELVWDPPWHPGLISAEGRKRLGLDQN
jgi:metal-sulfur cluster biosynthetic enzyme